MTDPLAEHLQVTTTNRGFDHMPSIPSTYGGSVRAYESSAAGGPHLWLHIATPSGNGGGLAHAHLTAADAWHLGEQLLQLVRDHYQGDARPAQRTVDILGPDTVIP